jgi:hypothetical protein
MNYLRDPIWAFVGATVATLVSFILFRLQQTRKALSYTIISQSSLLNFNEEVKGDLKIMFKGRIVSDVSLIIFKIFNSGKLPILSGDFERPMAFDFGNQAEILSAEVIEVTPKNLQALVRTEEKKIILEPLLLNSGDSMKLKVLLTGFNNCLNLNARIAGVPEISIVNRTELPSSIRFQYRVLVVLLSIAVLLALVFVSFKVTNVNTMAAVIGLLIPGIWGVISLKYGLFRYSKFRDTIDIIVILTIDILLVTFLLFLTYLSR